MARRNNNFAAAVDERTDALSDAALLCRSLGHRWAVKAVSRSRFRELYEQGMREYDRYCEHGCGATWYQLWSLRSKAVVENKRSYPGQNAYLMPVNTGRLSRGEAVLADTLRAGVRTGAL